MEQVLKTDLGGEKGAGGVAATAGGRPAVAPSDAASPGCAATADPHFAEILEIADDAIITVNAAQSITLFNRGAERIFGYKVEEALGRPLETLLPDRFRNHHRGLIQGFAVAPDAARVMAERREIYGRRKDGSEFPAEASIAKLILDTGLVFTVILRDVTARKAAEAALQRAHDELEIRVRERTAELRDSNRRLAQQARELARSNADLEQFAYVASHDLQEPLRMVASYTQLLVKRYRGRIDADADDFLNFIVDGALRMQRLINDLLAFSRVGTRGGELQPTSLATVMQRVLTNLKAGIDESRAAIRVDKLPIVWADATQMELLLQNLVSNAIKFRGAAPPTIHIAAQREDGAWQVAVSDQGIGIDPQYADRIFVIFQRLHTTADYPGTGIGLAICKRIVERHGGRIWVSSEPGRGSSFCFTLPDREEIPHESSHPSDQDPAGRR
ncbi:MAG: PAS domain S-box protein [Rhodocyclales bacterium]|nr:PAS domain S-box protein [Rhodocyclales bacterium]